MEGGALERLAAALEPSDYSDGQSVFVEGDPGDSMYFIASGCIRIEKRVSSGTSKTLTVLESGDYFGEMALLDQKPRSASALASGDSRVLRLSKAAFDQIQAGSSAAGMSMLFAMIRTSSERIRRLSSQLVVYDEVGKAIGEAQDLQRLLEVILQQLMSASGADWGLCLLRSQFSDRLELRVCANLNLTQAQRDVLCDGGGFLKEALQRPRDLLVGDFTGNEAFRSCARLGFETASLLVSPVMLQDQLLGLIVLGGNEPNHFDLDAMNLTSGVARQAAQAILNARHREEEQARSRHSRQYVRF